MTDEPGAPMFEARPPAKVNLTLEVVGRRPDGYHELRSIFLRIGLTDRLSMAPGGAQGSDTLTVSGLSGAPARGNLVLRALDAIRSKVSVPLPTLSVTLHKQIPIAAGLGGGSSDCASAIRLAQTVWGIGLSQDDELAVGAQLGSDVPFFLSGLGEALIEGRGERFSPAWTASDAAVLVVTPPIALRTAAVFARFDELNAPMSVRRDANDLWLAAASLEPSLPSLRDALETATGRSWLMSGSGPTLFALYSAVSEAGEAGRALVASRLPSLDHALINAVDLVGPDPVWRYP